MCLKCYSLLLKHASLDEKNVPAHINILCLLSTWLYMTSTNKLNILKNGKNSKIEIESYYEIIFNDVILIASFPDHLSHPHPAINPNPSALDVINK